MENSCKKRRHGFWKSVFLGGCGGVTCKCTDVGSNFHITLTNHHIVKKITLVALPRRKKKGKWMAKQKLVRAFVPLNRLVVASSSSTSPRCRTCQANGSTGRFKRQVPLSLSSSLSCTCYSYHCE